MRLVRTMPVLALAALALLLFACASSDVTPPETGREPARRVVFDMAHGEIFGADDQGQLGQSQAVERIRAAGFDVEVNTAPLTSDLLQEAAGLILAGPMAPLSAEEADAIEAYVRDGGTVLITIHVPFPVMALPARFDLPVTDGVVRCDRPVDPVDPGVFIANGVARDAVTEGVEGVLVLSGWGLSAASDEASIVVDSGIGTWVDVDGDGVRTEADPVGPFGIVGVSRVGAGTAIVVSDDGVFANVGIVQEENARLFDNIVRLMEASGRSA